MSASMVLARPTLLQIDMEVERGPLQDYQPPYRALYELPCYFGGAYVHHGSCRDLEPRQGEPSQTDGTTRDHLGPSGGRSFLGPLTVNDGKPACSERERGRDIHIYIYIFLYTYIIIYTYII